MKLLLVILVGIYNAQDLLGEYKTRMLSQINAIRYSTNIKSISDENFVFIENETDKLLLNKLTTNDINYTNNDYDETRAKIFGWFYKIRTENYKAMNIVGINKDTEVLDNWKIYMLLLSGNNYYKILKVCYPVLDAFSIILPNFETKCEGYAKNYNKLKESNNIIQTKSFLEKSSNTVECKYSIDALAEKFSVEELVKIKSLIKFAKRNKVIDKIYERGGDVDISEIVEKPKVVDNEKEIDELKNIIKSQNEKIGKLIDLVNNNTVAINDHKTQESLHFKQIQENIKNEVQTIKTIETKVSEQHVVNKTYTNLTQDKPANETNNHVNNSTTNEQQPPKPSTIPESPKIVQNIQPKPESKIDKPQKVQEQSKTSETKQEPPKQIPTKQQPPKPKIVVSPLIANRYYSQDDDYFLDSPKSNTQNQGTSFDDDFLNP